MAKSSFLQKSENFQTKLKIYAESIFKTYGKELVLRLEEYNLLQNKHNCIESSTAIGFVLEEFIVSKLEMYTHCDTPSVGDYVIDRYATGTTSESYDCYSIKDNIKYLVNIKAEKSASSNNAVAAIGQLHRNYYEEDPGMQKSYVVFKVKYEIKDAEEDTVEKRAKPRCLKITGIESYCLETIDFSQGYSADHRSWSASSSGKNTNNNGRLKVSSADRASKVVKEEDVSYYNTCYMLNYIYCKNL